MIYFASALAVLAMLGFMFFRVTYSLRKERISNEREATRGQHAFTRKHRARMLLGRAFKPPEEAAWQAAATERLAALQLSDHPEPVTTRPE